MGLNRGHHRANPAGLECPSPTPQEQGLPGGYQLFCTSSVTFRMLCCTHTLCWSSSCSRCCSSSISALSSISLSAISRVLQPGPTPLSQGSGIERGCQKLWVPWPLLSPAPSTPNPTRLDWRSHCPPRCLHSLPLDAILGFFLDQPNTFQHIGNVVNPPLLAHS